MMNLGYSYNYANMKQCFTIKNLKIILGHIVKIYLSCLKPFPSCAIDFSYTKFISALWLPKLSRNSFFCYFE